MDCALFKDYLGKVSGAYVPVFTNPFHLAETFNFDPLVWAMLSPKQVHELIHGLDAIDVYTHGDPSPTTNLQEKIMAYAHWCGIQAAMVNDLSSYGPIWTALYVAQKEDGDLAYWVIKPLNAVRGKI